MEGWVDLGYPAMHWPWVELATSRSQVRRPPLHYRATCMSLAPTDPLLTPVALAPPHAARHVPWPRKLWSTTVTSVPADSRRLSCPVVTDIVPRYHIYITMWMQRRYILPTSEQSSHFSHWSKQFACFPSPTQDTSVHCCFRKQRLTVT